MEAEQQLNALKGANLYSGSIENSPELKAALAKLSKSKNTLVNQEAKKLAAKLK